SIYFLVLIGYFVLLFIGFILFLIILMVNKLIKLLNFFIFFLLFFVLIILYFINKKNNLLLIVFQNIEIFFWVILNYIFLNKHDKELLNYYKLRISLIEGFTTFQFLLNNRFYIIDSTFFSIEKLGYTKKEIIGQKIDFFLQGFDCSLLKDSSDKEKISHIYRIKKKNNDFIPVEANFFFIKNSKNKITGYILICNDIELRQKYEFETKKENEAKFHFSNLLKYLLGFLEELEEAVAFLDDVGRLITANKKFLSYYKNIKNEILSLNDFIEAKEKTYEKIIKISEKETDYYYKYNLNYIPDKYDFPLGYITLVENISEKIKIKNDLNNFLFLFDEFISNFPLGILIFDSNFNIFYYSKNIDKFLVNHNLESSDSLKKILKYITINGIFERIKREKIIYIKNYKLELSKIFNLKNINEVFLNINIFSIDDEDNIFCIVFENINNYINYQNRSNKIKDQIDKIIDEKISFLTSLSCQFRSYLVFISETLNFFNKYNNEILLNYKEKINSNIFQLINQMDNIILYEIIVNNRIELNYQNIDIKKYINSKINEFEKEVKNKNLNFNKFIVFEVDFSNRKELYKKYENNSIYAITDISLLNIIIDNVLSNALKFTEKGYINFICYLRYLGIENYELEIKIQDTGIGINKSKLNNIFDRYYQIDELMIKRFSGLGLGMFLSKKLLEYLGGEIRIDSEVNKGTSVILKIPLMKSEYNNYDTMDHIDSYSFNFSQIMKNIIITFIDFCLIDILNNLSEKDKTDVKVIEDIESVIKNIKDEFINIIFIDLEKIKENQLNMLNNFLYKYNFDKTKIKIYAVSSFPFYNLIISGNKNFNLINRIII
ncbi:MAG: ATP-binding protein, partial [Exilispira sp.]